MIRQQKFGLILYLNFLVAGSFACTTIIAGKNATKDGVVIISRNSDSGLNGRHAKRMVFHPHKESKSDLIFTSGTNGFTYDLGKTQYSYTGLPYADKIFTQPPQNTEPYQFEQVGTNENNVSISATETIGSNPKVLGIDPYTTNGISETAIVPVIMALATSAKQGIELLGSIIEKQGAGEGAGFGVAIADRNGAWYLETLSGHQWIAVHIPDDSFFVSADQSRIQVINDPAHPVEYLSSPHLIDFAQKYLGYKPNTPFNVRDYFGEFRSVDPTLNYPRIAELIRLFTGIKYDYQLPHGDYPMFIKPSHPLTVNDIETGLGDHYPKKLS